MAHEFGCTHIRTPFFHTYPSPSLTLYNILMHTYAYIHQYTYVCNVR